jgi:hypothetical protein
MYNIKNILLLCALTFISSNALYAGDACAGHDSMRQSVEEGSTSKKSSTVVKTDKNATQKKQGIFTRENFLSQLSALDELYTKQQAKL